MNTQSDVALPRAAYIVCRSIEAWLLLALAVASPVWITPGRYFWTAFALGWIVTNGFSYTYRLKQWEQERNPTK